MTEAEATALIDKYCDCWKPMPTDQRRARLGALLSSDVHYIDPTVSVKNLDALEAHIDTVASKRPNAKVQRSSKLDWHHDLARFSWEVVDDENTSMNGSIDIVQFDLETRMITWIAGFFGQMISMT